MQAFQDCISSSRIDAILLIMEKEEDPGIEFRETVSE